MLGKVRDWLGLLLSLLTQPPQYILSMHFGNTSYLHLSSINTLKYGHSLRAFHSLLKPPYEHTLSMHIINTLPSCQPTGAVIGLGVLPSLLKEPGACEWVDDIEEGVANVGSVSAFTATGGSFVPSHIYP